jgi:hypothetical protein
MGKRDVKSNQEKITIGNENRRQQDKFSETPINEYNQ